MYKYLDLGYIFAMRSFRETLGKVGDTALAVTLAGSIVANVAQAAVEGVQASIASRAADRESCERTLANVQFVGYSDDRELEKAREETCRSAREYIR